MHSFRTNFTMAPSIGRNLRRHRGGRSAQQTIERVRALGAVQLLGVQNAGLTPFAFYNPFDWQPASRSQQLRSHRQQYAGARDGGIPWQLVAGDGHRADELAGAGTREVA